MSTLYTVGYGGRRPAGLVALLKENGINVVIDVRREKSRAFIRTYWAGQEMEITLALKARPPIEYRHAYQLGNNYDELEEYRQWLDTPEGETGIRLEAEWIQEGRDVRYCLLCAEKSAYDKAGKPKCHRVYVADALLKLLGEGWDVKHL